MTEPASNRRAVIVWSRKARQATERRNTAIAAWAAEGASLRAIAQAAGLTHVGVARILDRQAYVEGVEGVVGGS